jgi:hypothetical protein
LLANRWAYLGYYTDFEKCAKLRPSHGINTFAFANGAAAGRRCFLCNQLEAKTFAFANAPFAYANPGRGDVSPFSRRVSAVFGLGPPITDFIESPRQSTDFGFSLPPYGEQAGATHTDFTGTRRKSRVRF